uniref:sodium-coupled monocarboxylate transporter 1-like n=1 Tax=Styela clava TaxID=7725 RepID=UPI00193A9AAD|nr:sodium-coupled monocarboxylate transporter 1-like [Styela clava]
MENTVKPGLARDESKYFHTVDYVVFATMLFISASIGVFFAIRSRRKGTTSTGDYLMASREMSYGPVSLSLIASFMSSVTIIGLPAEYYVYGTMFTWFGVVYLLLPIILIAIYIPVFYDLGIASTYEYLELRYNKFTRLAVTCLYLILSTLYGGIVTYGPALALSKVTGLNMWGSIICTGGVCMFYTTLGGLKAVIWTDVLQSILMLSGFVIVIIQGSINLGGFSNIWEAAQDGGRIDFHSFEIDPRIRHTFWSILIGGSILWTSIFGVNQSQVQRYICCRTRRDANIAIIISGIGLIIIMILAAMTGLTIYATYEDCDPINNGDVDKADQLFPYIIMDIVGHLPGIPGLFVAAVFSSSLSTISSGINAMACVTLEDFIRPLTDWRDLSYTRTSRVLVLLYGCIYIMVAYLASEIGGLIRMSYSIHGIIGGPITGIFTIGMLASWVNSHGAMSGLLAGLASTTWLFVGSTIYPSPSIYTRPLHRSTDGCDGYDTSNATNVLLITNQSYSPIEISTPSYYSVEHSNASFEYQTVDGTLQTITNDVDQNDGERPPIAEFYALSYLHFATVGFLSTILVTMLVSALTGCTGKKGVHDDLLVPCLRSGKKTNDNSKKGRYAKVEGVERSTSWMPDKPRGASIEVSDLIGTTALVDGPVYYPNTHEQIYSMRRNSDDYDNVPDEDLNKESTF